MWRNPIFEKKSGRVMSDQRVPKMSFLGFQQKSNHLYVLVLLEYESTNSLLTFCKYHMSEKNLVMVPKPLD